LTYCLLIHPSPGTSAEELSSALLRFGRRNIGDGFVVIKNTKHAHVIARMFGVVKVSLAIECESRFASISNTIIKVGKTTVLPGRSFFVKICVSTGYNFAARDLEFAAAGALTSELAAIGSHPAKREQEADTIITAYVGKRSFVSLKDYEGIGGSLTGSLGNASCLITGPQSLASCVEACKSGFIPELLLLYSSEEDLYANAKVASLLAEKIGTKRQNITLMQVTTSRKTSSARVRNLHHPPNILYLDFVGVQALVSMMKSKNVILPIAFATHPQWFIEMALKEVFDGGKIPLTPLLFSVMQGENSKRKVTRQEFMKSKSALVFEKPKRIRLDVGPNYLNDILDSI
jgi:hypothetical protein